MAQAYATTRAHAGTKTFVPAFGDLDSYLASVHKVEPWRDAIREVVDRHGLRLDGEPLVRSDHKAPVFYLPSDRYLKLRLHWANGFVDHDQEVAAYELLSRDRSLEMPRPIGSGEIDPGCRYLVTTSVAGRPLNEVRPGLTDAELASIYAWVGGWTRRAHAVPIRPDRRRAEYAEFAARIELSHRYSRTPVFVREELLPPHLAEQVEAWLPSLPELLGSDEDAAIVHAALAPRHIFIRSDEGAPEPTGVIDLGAARIGTPMFDLVVAWRAVRDEPPDVGEAFLAAAALPYEGAELWRMALAWTLLIRLGKVLTIPDLAEIPTLDALARRIFSPDRPRPD